MPVAYVEVCKGALCTNVPFAEPAELDMLGTAYPTAFLTPTYGVWPGIQRTYLKLALAKH